jgi:hypothetical protein
VNWRRLFGLSFAFCAGRAAAQLTVESFPLNPYVQVLDGQWQGIKFASDGACYFASSTHDNRHGAAFFRYRPDTRELTMLAEDITRICGEDPTATPPQGKIHSDIVEHDGWLYFATHLGNYWPEAEASYTGAHVLGYELATGNFRDFGVIRSNHTIYAGIGVDPVRNKLITYTTRNWLTPVDSYLYRIDLATGTNECLGPVEGDAAFWFFVDRQGDCWLSPSSTTGTLMRVSSATGTVDRWPAALPGDGFWAWAQPLPDGDRCVFRLQDVNSLYLFDAAQVRTNPSPAFAQVQNIGPYGLGMALAADRVFYVQRANQQPGEQEYQDFHLLSVSLTTGAILDHGLIVDQSGHLVWRLPGLAADAQGRLAMVGDWWLLPGEQGSPTGTLRHVDGPGTNYTAEVRGEFFAVVDMWPIITNQPSSQTVLTNTSVTFTGRASGLPPLAYQWQFSGATIPGETNSVLTISSAQVSNDGDYRLIVANSLGSVTSAVARLTVRVLDTTPPQITCPATILQGAGAGQRSLNVTFPTPTATDDLPGVTAACQPPSGAPFPPRSNTTVICTATDASGNSATCSFQVLVAWPPTVLGGISYADGTVMIATNPATTLTAGTSDRSSVCVWTFPDGTVISNCTAVYTFTNCQPQIVSVSVGDGISATNESVSVLPACPMSLAAESITLRLNRKGLDKFWGRGWLNLPAQFDPTGVRVVLQAGEVQQILTLDRRGRGANSNGVLRLSFNKRKGWAVSFRFAGQWREIWAVNGLTNATVRNQSVHVPVVVITHTDPLRAFVGDLPLRYSAVKDKWGRATK